MYFGVVQLDEENVGPFQHAGMFIVFLTKAISVSPLIAYEYYLLAFEHLLVEASHLASTQINGNTFIDFGRDE